MGVDYPYSNPGYPIGKAHAVCDYASTHQQVDWGVDKEAAVIKYIEDTTIWYGVNAAKFAGYAKTSYCPQYLDPEY
jgi:hypothetical protein